MGLAGISMLVGTGFSPVAVLHSLYNTPVAQVDKQLWGGPFWSKLPFQLIRNQLAVRTCRLGIKRRGLT